VNPDPYYTPKISIGSFNLKIENFVEGEIDHGILQVLGSSLVFTNSGKQAISIAIEALNLHKSNTIGIVTTTGNTYVSNCVTETISQYCNWSMYNKVEKFDCLIVIHEFGFLLDIDSMNNLRKLNIPIINDFAYSFLSLYMSKRTDFSNEINLTSLPKSFNINFGGVVHLPHIQSKVDDRKVRNLILEELKNQLNVIAVEENISMRKSNRRFYEKELLQYGYKVIWNDDQICPGVCMISPEKPSDLQLMKTFLQRNGIESSVFYGREAFFVPVHNLMSKRELDYVCFMIGAFRNANQ
jgi:hypothetical protein